MKRLAFAIALLIASKPASAIVAPKNDRGSALILGDSHMYGQFGVQLHNLFSQKMGLESQSIAVCPATAATYMNARLSALCGLRVRHSLPFQSANTMVQGVKLETDNLQTVLRHLQPRVTIIGLGTNMGQFTSSMISRQSRALVDMILEEAPATTILWLGPPTYRGSRRIIDAIAASFVQSSLDAPTSHRAFFIDTSAFNQQSPLPRNNPHFGSSLAAQWASYSFGKILSVLVNMPPASPPNTQVSKAILRRCPNAARAQACDREGPGQHQIRNPSITYLE